MSRLREVRPSCERTETPFLPQRERCQVSARSIVRVGMTELSRHRSHVLAVAMAIVRDRTLAEDIVQDTFVIAFARRAQLRDPAAVTRWLASIARNRALDALRAQRREHGRTESNIEDVASTDDAAAECTRAA